MKKFRMFGRPGKKILTVLLASCLAITLTAVGIFADTDLSGSSENDTLESASLGADSSAGSDAAVPSYDWYLDNPEAKEFTISNADQLYALSNIVSGSATDSEGNTIKDSFSGKTIRLSSDIELDAYDNWTPIGTVSVGSGTLPEPGDPFAGTFDGQGCSITGLNAQSDEGAVALFGYTTGVLKDFQVSGSVKGDAFCAGVAVYGSGKISSVTSSVTVVAYGNCCGGILAEAAGDIEISGCSNRGLITNEGQSAQRSTGRVGGIVGRVEAGITATITNCSNTANITAYQYIGGIIGGCFGNVTIDSCYNTGDITGISFGKVYVAGIAGKLQGGTISNCYNTGGIYDKPWANGHIRAVGGIAGCEEDHTEGTAISNVYNVGTIHLDTSKMDGKYIYMAANISGGNQATSANTMTYDNCFYLTGSFPAQDDDTLPWSDVYKKNRLAYDTEYVTECTEAELKGDEVLALLGEKFIADPDGGYPLLYWQLGESPDPGSQSYGISTTVTGGRATVNVVGTALEGSTVNFTVTDIDDGRQIKTVVATDASGAELNITENAGTYGFTMPPRSVTITVVLENTPTADADSYALSMPDGLDPIWDVTADSTYLDSGMVKEGATVQITVKKADGADTAVLNGITVTDADGVVEVSKTSDGVYVFGMPGCDVSVTLDITYLALGVYESENGASVLKESYSRADMLALAGDRQRTYYSGWSSETQGFVGIAQEYVPLSELLDDAGVLFEAGDEIRLTAADGFSITYTYDYLYGTERYYYADILTNGKAATDRTEFLPVMVITGNRTQDPQTDISTYTCDMLTAYRMAFGQSQDELENATKITDSMPKCVTEVEIIHSDENVPKERGLSAKSLVMRMGGSVKITISDKAADISGVNYTFESGNEDVLTVDADGTLNALRSGSVVVTITSPEIGGYASASTKIAVTVLPNVRRDSGRQK